MAPRMVKRVSLSCSCFLVWEEWHPETKNNVPSSTTDEPRNGCFDLNIFNSNPQLAPCKQKTHDKGDGKVSENSEIAQ